MKTKHTRIGNAASDKAPKGTKKLLAPKLPAFGKKPPDISEPAKGARAKRLVGKSL